MGLEPKSSLGVGRGAGQAQGCGLAGGGGCGGGRRGGQCAHNPSADTLPLKRRGNGILENGWAAEVFLEGWPGPGAITLSRPREPILGLWDTLGAGRGPPPPGRALPAAALRPPPPAALPRPSHMYLRLTPVCFLSAKAKMSSTSSLLRPHVGTRQAG